MHVRQAEEGVARCAAELAEPLRTESPFRRGACAGSRLG
jgi:hypothetical protein